MSISTFRSIVFSAATLSTVLTSAAAQTPAAPQRFPLTDTKGLVAPGLTMDTTDFLGRKDVRLVKTREGSVDGFVPRLHRHRLPRPPGRLQLRHVLRSSGRCESRPAARLYLNDNPEPTLVVDGLKGLDLHHQAAAADQKRIEAAGTWDVTISTDAGTFAVNPAVLERSRP
jgi:hypothetical protein